MDGLTLAERIMADPGRKPALILMLRSAGWSGNPDRAPEVGIVASLTKPIRQLPLREAILKAVEATARREDRSSPDAPPMRAQARRPLRILIAEDNPFNQRVAVLMLAKLGHAATVAENGRKAIEAMGVQHFDLVLMDVQMPEMDGIEATMAIRSAELGSSRHMPIIAATAHALKEDRDRCLNSGMDGFLTKPLQEEALLHAIAECILPVSS
jgi:CheY-like chemotaxis protein